MKIPTLILAIAFALVTPALGSAQATDRGKPITPEQELEALDISWHQAVAAREGEALGRLLADDYQFDLDARRMLTKAQEVEAVRAQEPLFDFGAFKLSEVGVTAEGRGRPSQGYSPRGRRA